MQRMFLVLVGGVAILYAATRDSKPVEAKPMVARHAAVQPVEALAPHDDNVVEIEVLDPEDADVEVEDTGDDPVDADVDVELDLDAAIDIDVALDIAREATQHVGRGMITGVIRDAKSGENLAGVTVVVTSPSLEGAQTAITDENGWYRISSLPTGTYLVTVYYLEVTVEYHEIVVGRDRVTPLYAKIDTQPGITIDTSYVRNIPTPRYFEDPDDPRYLEDNVGVSFTGTSSLENTYYVNGQPVDDEPNIDPEPSIELEQ